MLFNFLLNIHLDPFLKQNLWLIVLIGCVVLALGIIIGYLLGNTSLKKFFYSELEVAEHQGTVQKSVTENVGLGIIVYDKNDNNGPVYVNKAVEELKGFIKAGIPRTLDIFLDTYDHDNHLKSDYLISIENGADEIRTNYISGNRVFEIKILRRDIEYTSKNSDSNEKITETLDIILVDDITQIKDDERRQKDLAANVSHELKTPLTVIRSSEHFVEKIKGGNMPTHEELTKWSTRILSNAIRMQDIVEDFLVLSNNSQTKHMGTFDFFEVVEQSIANIHDYPAAKSVTIVAPKRDAYSLGFGNSKLIVRIVTNLLTNAVKYIDYPDKTEPTIKSFPARNRIIAALTTTCLLTEGAPLSGSSITPTLVLNAGGNVCCVPYPLGTESLCNRLIHQGACLVEKADDILYEMNYKTYKPIF